MGNSTSYNLKGTPISDKNLHEGITTGNLSMDKTIRNFAEFLKLHATSAEHIEGITLKTITEHVCKNNAFLGQCIYKQFCRLCALKRGTTDDEYMFDSLTVNEYITSSHHFISLISDNDQVDFFSRGFSSDVAQIKREEVLELIKAAYQMAHIHHPVMCTDTANAVVNTVMHNKDTIGIKYFNKWCIQHCNRLVYWMHRHVSHTLVSTSTSTSVTEQKSADKLAIGDVKNDSDAASHISQTSNEDSPPQTNKKKSFKSSLKKKSPNLSLNLVKRSPSTTKKSSPNASPNRSPKAEGFKSTRRKSSFVFRAASEEHEGVLPSVAHGSHLSKSVTNILTETCTKITEQYEQQNDAEEHDEADADTPVLDGGISAMSLLSPSLMWLLTCSLPLYFTKNGQKQEKEQLKGSTRKMSLPSMSVIHNFIQKQQAAHWEPLYMSDRDGLGSNRFGHHALNYKGPTLMIVKAQQDDVSFCLAIDEEWKDSKNFWGGDDCLLMQIRPQYRIVERGEKIMYFNQNWRGFPTGIQVGGNYESRALTVDKDFSIFQYHNMPYKIGSVEVWGCGDREIRERQQEYKKRVAKDVDMRRKVKMTSSEWLEHPDRYLIEMAGGRTSYVHK